MGHFPFLVLCCVFVWTAGVSAAADDSGGASGAEAQPQRRMTNAPAVLSALRRESGTWNRDHTFPRDAADFAKQRGLALADAQVIGLLSRMLHRDRAIDAYMKWQLLGFEPALEGLDAAAYRGLMNHMPKLEQMPGPADDTNRRAAQALEQIQAARRPGNTGPGQRAVAGAGVDPTLSVVNGGAVLDVAAYVNPADPRYVTVTTRADQAEVIDIRQAPVIAAGNAVAVTARDQFAAALPAGDVRLVWMTLDVKDRIAAGEASAADAAKRASVAARELATDEALSPALRTQLSDWWYVIGQMATPVYREQPVEGTFARELQVHWVRVEEPVVARALAALRGEAQADQAQPVVESAGASGDAGDVVE